MTEDDIAIRRAAPDWPDKVAAARTLARKFRIEQGWEWQRVSGSFGDIGVPTLLITGSESPADLAEVTSRTAAAIPSAQVQVLTGHGHNALRSSPAAVAEVPAKLAEVTEQVADRVRQLLQLGRINWPMQRQRTHSAAARGLYRTYPSGSPVWASYQKTLPYGAVRG